MQAFEINGKRHLPAKHVLLRFLTTPFVFFVERLFQVTVRLKSLSRSPFLISKRFAGLKNYALLLLFGGVLGFNAIGQTVYTITPAGSAADRDYFPLKDGPSGTVCARSASITAVSWMTAAGMSAGNISAIGWKPANTPAANYNGTISIYMQHTTENPVSLAWDVSGATLVYSGSINVLFQIDVWHTFNFTTPFVWDGSSNVKVFVEFQGTMPSFITWRGVDPDNVIRVAYGTPAASCPALGSTFGDRWAYTQFTQGGASPLAVGTIAATQQTGTVTKGGTNQGILKIDIPTSGSTGTQTLNSVTVTTANTNNADIAANGVKLWVGSTLATATQLGTGQNAAATVTFSGLSQSISGATTSLWVTYDIASGATLGNFLDAQIASGGITITAAGGATAPGTQPVSTLNPAGNRKIDYCDDLYSIGCNNLGIGDVSIGTAGSILNQTATGCTGALTFADFTALSGISMSAGSTYPVNITDVEDFFPISSAGIGIWIDLNQNGSFGDVGELIGSIANQQGPWAFNITVPAGASSGTYRMRIKATVNVSQTLGSSCSKDNDGETHDYLVTISGGASCTSPSGTTATFSAFSSVSSSSITANVNYPNSVGATGYILLRNTSNTAPTAPASGTAVPTTAGNTVSWGGTYTYIGSTTTLGSAVAFTDNYSLSASTTYYYWVVAYQNTNGPCWFTPVTQSNNSQATTAATTITIANNNTVSAASQFAGAYKVLLKSATVTVTGGTVTLTGFSVPTSGTFQTGDLSSGFTLWYQTSSNTFQGNGTVVGTTSIATGNPSVGSLNVSLAAGTYYFFYTVNINSAATSGRTIQMSTNLSSSHFTFTEAIPTGSTSSSDGAQTINTSTIFYHNSTSCNSSSNTAFPYSGGSTSNKWNQSGTFYVKNASNGIPTAMGAGNISSISFATQQVCNTATSHTITPTTNPIKIWMRNAEANSTYTEGANISAIQGAMTLVYNSTAAVTSSLDGYLEFTLSSPFYYDGTSNLEVVVEYCNISSITSVMWVIENSQANGCYRSTSTSTCATTVPTPTIARAITRFKWAAACSAPSTQANSFTASSITASTASINWTNGNGSGRVVYINSTNSFVDPTVGANPTASLTYSSGQQCIFNGTGSGPVSVNGLAANSTYYLAVYEYCSPDKVYNASEGIGNFTTTCNTGESIANGNWSETATWCGGSSPTSGNVTIAHDVTLNSTVSVANLTINSSKTLTLNANQQLTVTGTLTNNGTLTLKDGATLVQGTSGTSIDGSGTYNVEKQLTGNSSTWNTANNDGRFWYMGVPMSSVVRSGFGNYGASSNRVWSYNETTKQYTDITSDASLLSAGTGYVHRRSDNNVFTFTATGANGLYASDFSLTGMTRTAGASAGYHLISNPYMAYLDWEAVTSTNIEPTYFIRSFASGNINSLISCNRDNDQYTSTAGVTIDEYADVRYIAPLQAIWVRVTTAGTGSLNMTRSMLSHQSTNPGLKNTTVYPVLARVNLNNDQKYDQMLVFMNEFQTNTVDNFDSEKMFMSGEASIYTMASGKKLVMNGLKNNKKKISVPLYLELPTSKVYQLQLSEYIMEDGLILLEDKQEGTMQDFTIANTYAFYANSGVLSNRFVLHFFMPDVTITAQGPSNSWVQDENEVNEGGGILVSSNGRGKVTIQQDIDPQAADGSQVLIRDASGRMVYEGQLEGTQTSLQLDAPSGVYFVEVQLNGQVEVKKIFVQQ
jgi:hypothetical protein